MNETNDQSFSMALPLTMKFPYMHSQNSTGSTPLALKLLHDVQEVIVHLWLVAELILDLVQVGKCIFHL